MTEVYLSSTVYSFPSPIYHVYSFTFSYLKGGFNLEHHVYLQQFITWVSILRGSDVEVLYFVLRSRQQGLNRTNFCLGYVIFWQGSLLLCSKEGVKDDSPEVMLMMKRLNLYMVASSSD
jgi:hypothetical protein